MNGTFSQRYVNIRYLEIVNGNGPQSLSGWTFGSHPPPLARMVRKDGKRPVPSVDREKARLNMDGPLSFSFGMTVSGPENGRHGACYFTMTFAPTFTRL